MLFTTTISQSRIESRSAHGEYSPTGQDRAPLVRKDKREWWEMMLGQNQTQVTILSPTVVDIICIPDSSQLRHWPYYQAFIWTTSDFESGLKIWINSSWSKILTSVSMIFNINELVLLNYTTLIFTTGPRSSGSGCESGVWESEFSKPTNCFYCDCGEGLQSSPWFSCSRLCERWRPESSAVLGLMQIETLVNHSPIGQLLLCRHSISAF